MGGELEVDIVFDEDILVISDYELDAHLHLLVAWDLLSRGCSSVF